MTRQPTPNVLDAVLGPADAELSPLTTWEGGRLAHLESIIEAGLQTFYDVGGALMEIREGRLYRQTHRSFEAYTKERWGMGKSRAHQLIEAASTVAAISGPVVEGEPSTMVDTLPTNERQVRALSGLDDQAKREVWAEAVHAAPDSKPTAKLVQEVRRQRERATGAQAIIDVQPSPKPSTIVDGLPGRDGRIERAQRLIDHCRAITGRAFEEEYTALIGRPSDLLAVGRALDKIVAELEHLQRTLQGEAEATTWGEL